MGEKKEKKVKTPKKEENGEDAAPKRLNISTIATPLADDKLNKKVSPIGIPIVDAYMN